MNRTSARRARFFGSGLLGLTLLAGVSYAAAATPVPAGGTAAATTAATTPTASAAPASPTWDALYAQYLAKGTVGDCASCHTEAATSEQTYDWLAQQAYMLGDPVYLLDPRSSCFSWLGGDMPPDGPSSYPRATHDFQAWAYGAPSGN